ncbi:MAG: acyltransferase, partial [Bacteroidaceae bacterium]|nr:acyltransferase [Bacteroidaceae bacterium]
FAETDRRIDEQGVNVDEVVIGHDVWVGANSTILPGVHIGEHVVIGAGSVVTRDVPPHSLCLGAPAKVIRSI